MLISSRHLSQHFLFLHFDAAPEAPEPTQVVNHFIERVLRSFGIFGGSAIDRPPLTYCLKGGLLGSLFDFAMSVVA
jgi:hypothetical protein